MADPAAAIPIATPAERNEAFRLACTLLNPFVSARPDHASPAALRHVFEFAAFHSVRPALLRSLPPLPQLPPAFQALRSDLAAFQVAHRFRVMQKTAEIVDLARALEAAGIDALFFKGAMLGEHIYGGAQFREFNDTDILVPPAEKDRAIVILEDLGYRPDVPDEHLRRGFFDYFRQHTFRHTDNGSMVDLHWDFVGTGPFPISAREALAGRNQVQLAGTAVPVPSRESLALILAGHGHKENWSSFSWVLDFARFAARHRDLDWSRIANRAQARGCLPPLLSATCLTEQLFGFVIDPGLAARAARQPRVARLGADIASRLAALALRQAEDDLMGGFRLCERPGQKLAMGLRLLITPTIGDYAAMRLPRRLWWTYRLFRPLRLILRKLRRLPPESYDDTALKQRTA